MASEKHSKLTIQDALDHLRVNGFNPRVCDDCRMIETELSGIAVLNLSAETIKEAFEALRAIVDQSNRSHIGIGDTLLKKIRAGEVAIAKGGG